MTDQLTIQQIIKQRFQAFFLDIKAAQSSLQQTTQPTLTVVELEQSKTARSLLRVEKQAIVEKNLNTKQAQHYLNENLERLNKAVEARLVEELKDTENLYRKVIGIDEALPELLDFINVKAATISKIELLATQVPWFYQDITKLVNQPKYRRIDSKGRVILVDNLRVALSMFGIENLNPVVVSLALRRWLPQITDPYPQIKLRIWEEALATSIVARKLAAISKVNENQAFALSMFHVVGTIAVVRLYFRLFDTVQREALIEAQQQQQHEQHAALSQLRPSGDFLNSLIDGNAMGVSAALINRMDLKRLFIANAMEEIATHASSDDFSELAQVVLQARGYARYRLLKASQLINEQESKDYVRSLHLPKGALQALKSTDIRTLNFTVAQN
ncbi:MAG: HDOD domain-containing protein [Paraglaciecola sp.]|nr:HDOD domain-containing protein [Paraglaciecola sp.]NCT46969.1 HDOD domain-containing protein [Paraglaciecola sp.]